MLDILEWEWACQIERRIKTRVIKEQSWWKTKYYWQGFVFPWTPLCPHWCPCLVSCRLSYPTGFTKLKRDWLFCSNFLCKPGPADQYFRFQEWWSYVYITVNHYSPFLFPGTDEQDRSVQLLPLAASFRWFISLDVLNISVSYLPTHIPRRSDTCMPTRCSHPSSTLLIFFVCVQHTQASQLLHVHAYSYHVLFIKRSHAHGCAQTCTSLKIQWEMLLRGIQSQCSWLESLSAASDVTSACSVSCSPPPSPAPFLFPILFHQLSPSFDTSEGVPHMPVTSPLLH